MSDIIALVVPLAVVGIIAVAASILARRRVPPDQRTSAQWKMMRVYLGIIVVGVILFIPLAITALSQN